MRILLFNNTGYVVGGAERYIKEISQLLQSQGHSTHLAYFVEETELKLTPDSTYVGSVSQIYSTAETKEKIQALIEQFRPDLAFLHIVYSPELINWLKKQLPSVAYVHSPYMVCPGYAQYLRRSSTSCPYRAGLICIIKAQTENCCFGNNPIGHAQRLKEVKSFITAYQGMPVIVGSRFMKRLLERNEILVTGTIPPAVRLSPIPAYIPPKEPTSILYQGRLIPEKGLHQLILALSKIEGSWRLKVAGEGEYQESVKKLAAAMDLSGDIDFLGWVTEIEIESLYSECAFVALPSLWPEPYGRSGYEAFFHSRAVVAFNTGGVSDWLEDGLTGFLIPPGDITALRQRIAELLNSPQLQRSLGQSAAQKASILWNPDDHYNKLFEIFRNAVLVWE